MTSVRKRSEDPKKNGERDEGVCVYVMRAPDFAVHLMVEACAKSTGKLPGQGIILSRSTLTPSFVTWSELLPAAVACTMFFLPREV